MGVEKMRVRILAGAGGGIQVSGETAEESDYLEWLGGNSPSIESGRCNDLVVLIISGNPSAGRPTPSDASV
jgi:hypothetical protein